MTDRIEYTDRDILRAYVLGRPLTEQEQRDMTASLDERDAADRVVAEAEAATKTATDDTAE